MDVLNEIKEYKVAQTGQDTVKNRRLAELENTPQGSQAPSFGRLNSNFATLQNILQETEMPPTIQTVKAVVETQKQFNDLLRKWNELKQKR